MIIELLMMLAGISHLASASRTPPLEQVMRDTLTQVMKCPEWATDEDIEQPVAAFSPARYMQLVALVRKESKENSCGRRSQSPFHLNNPRSWNFCAMGICSEDTCSCFKNFVGEKCNKFQGRCWLFYCRLVGCNKEAPTLYCSCGPSLYGSPVARGIYFYDHGFEQNYIPPPFGYTTTSFVDSHLIRKTAPDQYEIIGGNYNNDVQAVAERSYIEKKYSYNFPRLKHAYPVPDQTNEDYYKRDINNPNPKLFRKNFNRKYYQYEKPREQLESSDFNEKQTHSKQNRFRNVESYNRWDTIEEGVKAPPHKLQTSQPLLNYAYSNGYNVQPRKVLPNFVPQRSYLGQKTGRKVPFKNLGSPDSSQFQIRYENNNVPYQLKNSARNYGYRSNEFPAKNYYDFRNNKGLQHKEENGKTVYDPADYRMRREQEISPLEENTIKETWADDEEEADDEENFKYVSESGSNRYSYFLTSICSVFLLFLFPFL